MSALLTNLVNNHIAIALPLWFFTVIVLPITLLASIPGYLKKRKQYKALDPAQRAATKPFSAFRFFGIRILISIPIAIAFSLIFVILLI